MNMLSIVEKSRYGVAEPSQNEHRVKRRIRLTHMFEEADMLTDTDWIMHAKATRSMAARSLRHGETEVARRLFQAASQMDIIAAAAAAVMSPGGKVVKLTAETR